MLLASSVKVADRFGVRPLIEREHAQVARHCFAGVDVALFVLELGGDGIGQDHVHPVTGQTVVIEAEPDASWGRWMAYRADAAVRPAASESAQ